jgi:hypothetical protein
LVSRKLVLTGDLLTALLAKNPRKATYLGMTVGSAIEMFEASNVAVIPIAQKII